MASAAQEVQLDEEKYIEGRLEDEELLEVLRDHDDKWYNPHASSKEAASGMLYERVKTACKEKLGMKEGRNTSPLTKLVLPNVPQDFNKANKDEGLVEVKMEIEEKDTKTQEVFNNWTILIDADPKNPGKQDPHFGFQVSKHPKNSAATKFTGHIFFSKDPDHVRPGPNTTSFSGTQQKGSSTRFFYMTGTRFYVNL